MEILDLTGLRCPLPLLRLKVHLQKPDTAASLLVKTTDPASERDFQLFLQHQGHRLVSLTREHNFLLFLIEKSV